MKAKTCNFTQRIDFTEVKTNSETQRKLYELRGEGPRNVNFCILQDQRRCIISTSASKRRYKKGGSALSPDQGGALRKFRSTHDRKKPKKAQISCFPKVNKCLRK